MVEMEMRFRIGKGRIHFGRCEDEVQDKERKVSLLIDVGMKCRIRKGRIHFGGSGDEVQDREGKDSLW